MSFEWPGAEFKAPMSGYWLLFLTWSQYKATHARSTEIVIHTVTHKLWVCSAILWILVRVNLTYTAKRYTLFAVFLMFLLTIATIAIYNVLKWKTYAIIFLRWSIITICTFFIYTLVILIPSFQCIGEWVWFLEQEGIVIIKRKPTEVQSPPAKHWGLTRRLAWRRGWDFPIFSVIG